MATLKSITRSLASLALLAFLACGGDKEGDPIPPPPGATAPAITAQPQAQTVSEGQVATFQVTATGTAPLGYQWKKDGTAIPSATSHSYTTPATALGDDGASFTVTVSNSAGQVTSSAAVLHVTGGTVDVTVTLDPSKTMAISPYIYGRNFYGAGDPPHLTLNRQGGNRWTAYNWENNASNSGTDWGPYSNDSYLGGGTTPAEAVRSGIAEDQSRSMATLMTVQMQGYVAADKNGLVDPGQAGYLSSRFKQVVYRKAPAAFTATPSATDASVYMDEFLWALRNTFTEDLFGAGAALPTFVSLDNEPELWSSTHDILQPAMISPEAYLQKTIQITQALKNQAPGVKLFGPVHYGFNGIVNWQNAGGFSNSYWFTDKFLQELKVASETYGARLLDVYDFHWYSEAQDGSGHRITGLTGETLSAAQVQAIVQSPRSLWDPTYTEASWVASYLGAPVRILDRLQSKIDANWPGTGLAITEYANGGDRHIAGTLAQADNLGVFADRGVFAACYWPLTNDHPYVMAGFRAYRGFDGAGAHFGDITIHATSSQIQNVSVHASRDSQVAGRFVFVAINRSTNAQNVQLTGQALAGTAKVYRISAESAQAQLQASAEIQPVDAGQISVSGSQLTLTLPPLSVSTIEVR